MKKFALTCISLLIAVITVMSLTVLCISAAGTPKVAVNDTTASAGSTATLTVSLSDNPGLIVMRLSLEYDEKYFTVDSVKDGGKLGIATHSNIYNDSPYIFYWNNPLRTTNIETNGDLATITFNVKEGTPNGTYPVKVYAANYDILDADIKSLGSLFTFVNGSIKVTGNEDEDDSDSSSSSSSKDEPLIYVTNASVRAGKQFSVDVVIDDNPGVVALRTLIDYNDKYFEIIDVEDHGILGDKVHSDVYDEAPYALYWSNPLVKKDITKDGELVTITFKAKSNTPAGKYKFSPSSGKLDIINYDLDALGNDFDFEAGIVTVTNTASTDDQEDEDKDKDKEDSSVTIEKTWKISLKTNVLVELTASSVSYGEGRLVSLDAAALTQALKEADSKYPGKKIDVSAVYSGTADGDLIVNLPEGYADILKGVNSFSFDTPKAYMCFDAKAVEELAEVDDSVQFIFGNDVPKNELAKLTKGKYDYYDITSTAALKDGKVKVTLPYEVTSDNIGKYAVVSAYNAEEKKLEAVGSSAAYSAGEMSFETAKVMPYVITVESVGFKDIEKHWARDYINFVAARGIFNGRDEETFDPDTALSRGMLVTVLGRLEQIELSGYNCMFADVDKNLYYAPYIEWARQNNIVGGVGNNKFEPERSVTRQEMAVIISNYLEFKGKKLDVAEQGYDDKEKIDSWAKDSVNKVGKAGIITGVGKEFQPKSEATRAQAATILQRIIAYLD